MSDKDVKKVEKIVSAAVVRAAIKSGKHYDISDKNDFDLLSLRALQAAIDELNHFRVALERRAQLLRQEMQKEIGSMLDLDPKLVGCVEISWVDKVAYVASDDEVMEAICEGGKYGKA